MVAALVSLQGLLNQPDGRLASLRVALASLMVSLASLRVSFLSGPA
jgi:hypothetical protein